MIRNLSPLSIHAVHDVGSGTQLPGEPEHHAFAGGQTDNLSEGDRRRHQGMLHRESQRIVGRRATTGRFRRPYWAVGNNCRMRSFWVV